MFSGLVDEVMVMIGRSNPRTRANVIKYARMTIRECSLLEYFHRDFVEDQIITSAAPFIWDKPKDFRQLRTVEVPDYWDIGKYPPLVRPGKKQRDKQYFYYASTTYFVFAGYEIGTTLNVGIYYYPKYLAYYENPADRPAVYDRVEGTWTYNDAYDDTPELMEEAEGLVSNWLLQDWDFLIQEGTLAKVYKMLREERMASVSYRMFKEFQEKLRAGEASESYNV